MGSHAGMQRWSAGREGGLNQGCELGGRADARHPGVSRTSSGEGHAGKREQRLQRPEGGKEPAERAWLGGGPCRSSCQRAEPQPREDFGVYSKGVGELGSLSRAVI